MGQFEFRALSRFEVAGDVVQERPFITQKPTCALGLQLAGNAPKRKCRNRVTLGCLNHELTQNQSKWRNFNVQGSSIRSAFTSFRSVNHL